MVNWGSTPKLSATCPGCSDILNPVPFSAEAAFVFIRNKGVLLKKRMASGRASVSPGWRVIRYHGFCPCCGYYPRLLDSGK